MKLSHYLISTLLYNANGNLIGNYLNNKREYEYIYDIHNRLISVSRYNELTTKELLISFEYDPLGRRTTKQVANQRIEYIYDGENAIEEIQYTVNPTTGAKTKKETREYTYGIGGTDDIIHTRYSTYTRIKKVDTLSTTGDYYYEKNHLGSITRITSSTGTTIDEYAYTVFGKPYRKNLNNTYKPLSGSNKSPIGNTRLYTGREYDREVSLSYHRARYYDSELGRFTGRDPIGMVDNINLYTYVENNPIKFVDRMGLEKKIVGTLRIYSLYGDYFNITPNHLNPLNVLDGHAWIEITVGNKVTSYGIGRNWKDSKYAISNKSDITKNLELDNNLKNQGDIASLGINITQTQLDAINNYISKSINNNYEWGYFSPCTDFASDIWNTVSDVKLDDRAIFGMNSGALGLSTPDALAQSIAKVIINKGEYEENPSMSNVTDNPYKNIIY